MEWPGQSKPQFQYVDVNGDNICITMVKYNLRDPHYKMGPEYIEYAFIIKGILHKLQTGNEYQGRNKKAKHRKLLINQKPVDMEIFYQGIPPEVIEYLPDFRKEGS